MSRSSSTLIKNNQQNPKACFSFAFFFCFALVLQGKTIRGPAVFLRSTMRSRGSRVPNRP